MLDGKVPMTPPGQKRLRDELEKLREVDAPQAVKDIATARDHGDLSENAEYHAAKERQGMVHARMKYIEDVLSRAEVIDPATLGGDRVIQAHHQGQSLDQVGWAERQVQIVAKPGGLLWRLALVEQVKPLHYIVHQKTQRAHKARRVPVGQQSSDGPAQQPLVTLVEKLYQQRAGGFGPQAPPSKKHGSPLMQKRGP